MKKFEGLGRSLSKEQQKRIVGGACSCTCSGGSTGSWTYDNNAQPSDSQIRRNVGDYCGSGSATCSGYTQL
jgi:hypothetical protein